MLNFLKQSRIFVNSTEPICIVLGNESCDLDSAVCALTLAYHYQQQNVANGSSNNAQPQHFLPVLNIPRRDYALKTEVKYLFEQQAIDEANLTFRDELQQDFLERSKFILVDHHVSPFAARCLEVFDHRVVDEKSQLPNECKMHIELVGSCATLIAEHLLAVLTAAQLDALQPYEATLHMVRSTIVLDTVNFSEVANRATPKDFAVCATVEDLLRKLAGGKEPIERTRLFDALVGARADISRLTALQLLRKDLKIIKNANSGITIAFPGFPILVQQFVEKEDAAVALHEFAKEINAAVVILMGMLVTNGSVQRDLGFIDIRASELCATIRQKLLTNTEPTLCLQQYEIFNFLKGSFYKMNNIKATRKHILPLVKKLLDEWKN